MKFVPQVKVEIANPPLRLQRQFTFRSSEDRDAFLAELPEGVTVVGHNCDHIMTLGEVLAEIEKEKQPL